MDSRTASNPISRLGTNHWAIAGLAGVVAVLLLTLAAGLAILAALLVAGVLVAVLLLVFGLVRDPAPRASARPGTAPKPVEPKPVEARTELPVGAPAATPVQPQVAPEATAALVAGSGGSGGGAAAATSPAATGTPPGEGPATGADSTEADLAARAADPVADPAAEPMVAEHRPAALDAPRPEGADDLKRIRGIGPKLERTCNGLGFWHFDQIAAWTEAEVAWVDENLPGFRGRVSRDAWVAQARDLAGRAGPSAADGHDGAR